MHDTEYFLLYSLKEEKQTYYRDDESNYIGLQSRIKAQKKSGIKWHKVIRKENAVNQYKWYLLYN